MKKYRYKMLIDGEKKKGTISSYNEDTAVISLFNMYFYHKKKLLSIQEI